jgi:diaminohydroxyphosphoribosylaminopyrimidine deaminase/5-amino-6-(5-phosphoribosylamino)uracil reductase
VFFHFIRTGTPYVVMKYAMTMDGKIATRTGLSKWITGERARRNVQEDRHRYTGIMVGIGTVLADDPLLTCRLPGGRSPVRIVCDTKLLTPLDARVVKTADEARTILATCRADPVAHQPYLDAGCRVLFVPERDGHIDLNFLMRELGAQGIDGILLEGGGTLNYAALESGIVNKVQAYLAPKLFGGAHAKTPVGGTGVASPAGAFRLSRPAVTVLGDAILLESEVISCSRES